MEDMQALESTAPVPFSLVSPDYVSDVMAQAMAQCAVLDREVHNIGNTERHACLGGRGHGLHGSNGVST
jgi:hypothetical protein